jgi:hypothetical protein
MPIIAMCCAMLFCDAVALRRATDHARFTLLSRHQAASAQNAGLLHKHV